MGENRVECWVVNVEALVHLQASVSEFWHVACFLYCVELLGRIDVDDAPHDARTEDGCWFNDKEKLEIGSTSARRVSGSR